MIGALYVSKDAAKIFDKECEWQFVYNYKGPVVDIDYKQELPSGI